MVWAWQTLGEDVGQVVCTLHKVEAEESGVDKIFPDEVELCLDVASSAGELLVLDERECALVVAEEFTWRERVLWFGEHGLKPEELLTCICCCIEFGLHAGEGNNVGLSSSPADGPRSKAEDITLLRNMEVAASLAMVETRTSLNLSCKKEKSEQVSSQGERARALDPHLGLPTIA